MENKHLLRKVETAAVTDRLALAKFWSQGDRQQDASPVITPANSCKFRHENQPIIISLILQLFILDSCATI